MSRMFEKEQLAASQQKTQDFEAFLQCKIEEGMEGIYEPDHPFSNPKLFPFTEDEEFQDSSSSNLRFGDPLIKSEEDGRKLMHNFKQLTKRKPLEGPKKKVVGC